MVSEERINILEGGHAVCIDKGFRRASRTFNRVDRGNFLFRVGTVEPSKNEA